MEIILFDIETSSLNEGDILQFSAVKFNSSSLTITDMYSKYYLNYLPIEEEAYKVHHLTEDFLKANAEGYYENDIDNINDFFRGTQWLGGFNLEFDLTHINTCHGVKKKDLITGYYIDLMYIYTDKYSVPDRNGNKRYMSLKNVCNKVFNSNNVKCIEEYLENNSIVLPEGLEIGYHNSLYDCLCYVELYKDLIMG